MANLILCRYLFDPSANCFRPMIRIRVHNRTETCNGRVETIWALVDSGAHVCCLPKWVVDGIGHNWSKGKKMKLSGVTGMPVDCHKHTAHIELADYPGHEFETLVVVVDRPKKKASSKKTPSGMTYAILGQKGFFENFILRDMDWDAGTFSLEPRF